MDQDEIDEKQRALCALHATTWCPTAPHLMVGVARNVRSTTIPVNGLRHPPDGDTTGWYLWAGEGDPALEPDFFVPLHVAHLAEWRPEVLKFLGLPPGWRFLTDGTYEDVWEDAALLDIQST